MPLKDHALRIIRGLAPIFPISTLIRFSGRGHFFPVYHLTSDHPAPHLEPIYPVRSTQLFREDLDYLLRHFQPIGIEDILADLQGRRPLPANCFWVSFDDGLRQVYDEALPILVEKGVPATVFLNNDFIDNRDLFFRYKAALLTTELAKGLKKKALKKFKKCCHHYGLDWRQPRPLMKVDYAHQALLDEVARIIGFSFEEWLSEYRPYLTSDQIRDMMDQGITFGGHSLDHPEYRFLPLEQQVHQTLESILNLRRKFGLRHNYFAFPFTDFGIKSEFFQKVYSPDIYHLHPERVALSCGCAGLKSDTYPNHVQRVPMEGDLRPAKQLVKSEYLYYLLKSPLGKNRIERT